MYCIYYNTQFFLWKTEPNEPRTKIKPKQPNWHHLPNWEPGLLGRVVERFCAPSCSPSGAKTSQMGVCNPYIPKYKKSCPKFNPHRAQQQAQPPAYHIWHCLPLFTGVPYPYPAAPPYYTLPPSHPAPSAYQPPYPLTLRTILVS